MYTKILVAKGGIIMWKILYYGNNQMDFLSYHKEPERKSAFRICPLSKDIYAESVSQLVLPEVDAIIIDADFSSSNKLSDLVKVLSNLSYPIYLWLDEKFYDVFSSNGFNKFVLPSGVEKLSLLYDCISHSERNTAFFT